MKEKICNYFKDFLSLQVEGEKNMKDEEIINLYLNKSENAIYETEKSMENIVNAQLITFYKIKKIQKSVLMMRFLMSGMQFHHKDQKY